MTVPPRRQRTKIHKELLNDLAESIVKLGLLHPIVVRPLDNDVYQLVCGQRRLEAVRSLKERRYKCDGQEVPIAHIAVTYLSELDPISRMEAEFEENILRVDLTDIERDLAVAGLHELRQQQAAERGETQTQQDTAKELAAISGKTVKAEAAIVSRAQIIARHKDDPIVQNARTSGEAYAAISRRTQAMFEAKLAATVSTVPSPHTLIHGDLLFEMEKLPNDTFDCIIADPPYGIGADKFGDAGPAHTYTDDADVALGIMQYIIQKGAWISKTSSHLYLFCDVDNFIWLRGTAEKAGWSTQRTPIIWYKGGMGFDPYPGIGFKRTYEMLLYCWRGKKPHRQLLEDVIEVRGEAKDLHAAAKPVDLYRMLLNRSCIAGDSVLDPCCGSGTIFAAANALQLKATGIEIDEGFATLARARMTPNG